MASLKYQENGEIKELAVKVGDTLPIGTEVDYNGSAAPSGWVEIEDLDDKYVSVGNTAPINGERVWFKQSNNLLNLANATAGTKKGITLLVDTTAGTITLSGTSTSYTAFDIPINLSGKNTISCDNWGQFTIYLQYNGSGVLTVTSNTTYNGNVDNMVIGIQENVTINKTIKLQVEKGETATDFEPYVEYKSISVDNKPFTEAVSVGAEENNSRVWFRKGKNLVDKNTVLKMTTINATTGLPESTSNFSFTTQLIKVKPNTDYYVKAGPVVIYAYDINKSFMSIIKNNAQAGTFNTGSAEYIRGRNWWANNTNEMNTQIDNAFIYEGTTDTTYEPYITPSINLDNEEIYSTNYNNYSTNEIVVGQFLGKPLYRKVIQLTTTQNNDTKTYDLTSLSISEIKHIYGTTHFSGYTRNLYNTYAANGTVTEFTGVYIGGNTLTFKSYNSNSGATFYGNVEIVIEYTKTTD